MKKYFLLLILGFGHTVFSQTPINMDFLSDFPKEKKVKGSYKEEFVININNVNRKLFKVETNKTKTDLNMTVPSALKSIKLPSFLSLSLPETSEKELNLPVKADKNDNPAIFHNRIEELLADIERRGKKLDSSIFLYNSIIQIHKNCSYTYTQIQSELKIKVHSYLQLPGKDTDYALADVLGKLSDTLKNMYPQANKSLLELKRIIPNYLSLAKNDLESAIQSLEESRPARGPVNNDLEQQITRTKAQMEIFKQKEALLKKQLEEAKELVDAMYEFERDDKINVILSQTAIIENTKNYNFTSQIVEAKKDEIRYKITVTPIEINSCGIIDPKTTEVVIQTKGGLKIDFSTGLFLLNGNEKFLGESYYWENLDATSRKIVTAERGSRLQLSIGALAHFYQRSYSKVKLAGTLGVSTSAGFDDLNFHVGPSLIFGNKDRLIFSAGVALKSTKVLDRNLNVNTAYLKDNSPDEIPIVSQFPVSGWFIGITYNISNFKSE